MICSDLNAGNIFMINCNICGGDIDISGMTVGQYRKMLDQDIICDDCKIDIRNNKIEDILK